MNYYQPQQPMQQPPPQQQQGFYQLPQQQYQQYQQYQQPLQQQYQQPQGPYQQLPQQQYQQPQQQYQQPQQQMAAPPVVHHIDDAAALEEYNKVRESLASGGLAGFISIPGPNGEKNWDRVHVGYEGSVLVHVCGPWAPGVSYTVMQASHFYKSHAHPNGASVSHTENCLWCSTLGAQPKDMEERLKPWKRVRVRYLYNVCWLENLAAHYPNGPQSQPQALVLAASKTLHGALGTVFTEGKGVSNLVDYQSGRPIRVIKRKTGPKNFDIDWAAIAAFESKPLPPEFWPVAANLVDLSKLVKESTQEEVIAALAELGLAPGQVPQSYHPGAQPPHGNPYVVQGVPPQPQPQQQQQQQFNPYMAPEMVQQVQQAQPPQQQQMPVQYAVPPTQQPPMTGSVPPMPSPPAVSSGEVTASYQPQPSGALPPTQQPPPQAQQQPQQQQQAPQQQVQASDLPRQLAYPLPAGTVLPDQRQRCFGSFDGSDAWCGNCVDWIRSQCMPISAANKGAQQQPQPSPEQQAQLQALQNQLTG